MRKYTYYRVMQATDTCPEGELLTACELKNLWRDRYERKRPIVELVKVPKDAIYWFFGCRFAVA